MKSKVSIDIDFNNQPIIKIEYNESEDVRDKLVKRFLERFGGTSQWAEFRFSDALITDTPNSLATITPISPDNLTEHSNLMKTWADHVKLQEKNV